MKSELKLHKYQTRAADFVENTKTAALFIDLGLGKTAIVLEVIKRLKQPTLVIGPLRVIHSTWPEEIKKWAPHLTYKILHGPDKSVIGCNDYDILLINYEGLKWFSEQRGPWKKRMVVFDESSMVKSHSTQRFKLLRKMRGLWNSYVILLSATPAPNSLSDLWSQFFLLDGGKRLGKNISEFRRLYCSSFSFPGMPVTLYKVIPEREQEIYDQVKDLTFRLEAKDYLDMPPIRYNRIMLNLTPKLMKQYKELEQEFFLELGDANIEVFNAAALSMKLRQFIQGGLYDEEKLWNYVHSIKLQALKELVETSAGQPILCAIQFKGELEVIRKAFPSVPIIAGGTTAKQATTYIKSWNEGKIPLLLCHPASLSHGVNLQTGGHLLLWYGLTWSLEQYSQLNGRLYRQGQTRPVVIHQLVMKNTVDEAVIKALKDKTTGQNKLLTYLKKYREA